MPKLRHEGASGREKTGRKMPPPRKAGHAVPLGVLSRPLNMMFGASLECLATSPLFELQGPQAAPLVQPARQTPGVCTNPKHPFQPGR